MKLADKEKDSSDIKKKGTSIQASLSALKQHPHRGPY